MIDYIDLISYHIMRIYTHLHVSIPAHTRIHIYMYQVWCDYFDVTADSSLQLKKDQKYMLFEFPHGIFPMGQLLSVYWIEKIFPGHMFCGTAADVVFKVPVMRHLFVSFLFFIVN